MDRPDAPGLRRPVTGFRRTLLAAAAAALAALVGMAALLAAGLARSDGLLEQLRRSQDQLAQVTRIQAEVERLRADVASGAPDVAGQAARVDESLQAYRASVREEGRALGDAAGPAQSAEAENAERMVALFAEVQGRLLGGAGAAGEAEARRRFEDLAERAVARERAEAAAASLAMGELRRTLTLLAVAIPLALAAIAAAGVWMLLRNAEIEAGRRWLAEVDANRRLFVSKLGHELRTPATVIRGEAEVALRERDAPPERLREALEVVVGHSAFLQRRLEDMLALARAEDGRVALHRQPVDLAAVVRAAADLAEPYVRANGLALAVEIEAPAGAALDGDESWLKQALLALVDNAARHGDGGAPIRLSLSRQGDRARIVVADSGPGVAPAEAARIFDAWTQGSAGRDRGGAGLGLSVARWVVEQHGGEIRAQTSPGRGLAIEIELPVRA